MEYLPNGFQLKIPPEAFPLGTDSMALAHFVRLPRNALVLDIGSGCGTLGLLLCAKNENCAVTGVELDPRSHEAAVRNIRSNGLADRMESICADAARIPELFPPGHFSLCVSNPPYFSGGPASSTHPLARREDMLSLENLMKSAAWALKFGGDLFIVHRPERLAQIIALGSRNGLEAKRLCLLRHRPGDEISMILLQLRKGGKPGIILEDAALYLADGTPSKFCRDIYHMEDA